MAAAGQRSYGFEMVSFFTTRQLNFQQKQSAMTACQDLRLRHPLGGIRSEKPQIKLLLSSSNSNKVNYFYRKISCLLRIIFLTLFNLMNSTIGSSQQIFTFL